VPRRGSGMVHTGNAGPRHSPGRGTPPAEAAEPDRAGRADRADRAWPSRPSGPSGPSLAERTEPGRATSRHGPPGRAGSSRGRAGRAGPNRPSRPSACECGRGSPVVPSWPRRSRWSRRVVLAEVAHPEQAEHGGCGSPLSSASCPRRADPHLSELCRGARAARLRQKAGTFAQSECDGAASPSRGWPVHQLHGLAR